MNNSPALHPPAAPTAILLEAWFTPVRFGLVLGALIAVAFPDVLLGVKSFYYRDFGLFGYPLAFYHREQFWRGEFPLWNPLSNCGLPFLAQWNTMVLYPGTLIYLLFPLPWSLSIFCLGHQWLAGLGMYYLARHWTGSGWAAMAAGLVYAFNGLTLNSLMWPNNIAALGWMPWVVLSVSRAWQGGLRQAIIASWIGALQMLCGAPEIVVMTWTIVGLLMLGERLPETTNEGFRSKWRSAGRRVACSAGIVLVIAGLAAAQLLPFLDLLGQSQRDTGFGDAAWSMPGTGWANFWLPLFHCFSGPQGVFFQYDQWWTSSYYVGTTTLVLAAGACWWLRSRRIACLALIALLGLLLALGNQGLLFPWLRAVFPGLGYLRYPIKSVVLVAFAVPLMMAFGLRHISSPKVFRSPSSWRWLWCAGALTCGIIAFLMAFAWHFPLKWDEWPATAYNGLQRAAFLLLILAAINGLGRAATVRTRSLLAMAVSIVLWADLLTHVPQQNPTIVPAGLAPDLVQLTPHPGAGQARAMVSPEADSAFRKTQVTNALNHYLGYRLGLICNCNLLDHIAIVGGFYSLYLNEAEAVRLRLYSQTNLTMTGLMDFLGVSQVTKAGSLLEWSFRPSFLPLVTAGQKPEFLDEAPTMRALASAAFQPTNVVFLPKAAQDRIQVREKTNVRLHPETYGNHRLILSVETTSPALIVVAQAYHPNWQARVDDHPTALWRANFAFQAVEVPTGKHRVELKYQDRAFASGTILSAVALGLTLAGWIWLARTGNEKTASFCV
jgi:hypothetical protein